MSASKVVGRSIIVVLSPNTMVMYVGGMLSDILANAVVKRWHLDSAWANDVSEIVFRETFGSKDIEKETPALLSKRENVAWWWSLVPVIGVLEMITPMEASSS